MKKSMLAAAVLAALMVPQVVGAEGFGINQWSTEGVAMGGANMFADNDPANISYNPAAIVKVKGNALKMGATYISPHGKHEAVAGPMANPMKGYAPGTTYSSRNRVHPGWVPGTYFVHQMDDKNWWGIGCFTRYGLVSGRQPGTLAATNNLYAKMNGLSVTPVFAHKFDKKWSAAVGADINYVGLEMNQDYAASQLSLLGAKGSQLKGDSYALGWNAAVNYAFDDKNEFGVVYRSKIKHSLEADFRAWGVGDGDAYGVVTLPDQWSIGYSHKFDEKNRVELNATRTNWHTYDSLNINLSGAGLAPLMALAGSTIVNPKNYGDTWRYAIGYERKFSEKYTGMIGFAFDQDRKNVNGGDFICPVGQRRTYSIGARYNDKKQAVALAIGFEQIGDYSFNGVCPTDAYKYAHNHNNFAKIFSVGYEYHF